MSNKKLLFESAAREKVLAGAAAIADAVRVTLGKTDRVGTEGAVTVEEAKGTETVLDIVDGLQFDRGFLSPYFVTDPEKMEVVLNPLSCRTTNARA